MKPVIIGVIVVAVLALRITMFRARRRRRVEAVAAPITSETPETSEPTEQAETRSIVAPSERGRRASDFGARFGNVGIIAMREITERVRGRIFRVGTLVILAAVAAAIVIPSLQHNNNSNGVTQQKVGVVGRLSSTFRHVVTVAGTSNKDHVTFVAEPSLARAKKGLRDNSLAFAIVHSDELLLNEPATQASSPADPTLVQDVATYFGLLHAYQSAGLTAAQTSTVGQAHAIAVHTLTTGQKNKTNATSTVGLVLLFVMLTQYCTWILIGVMQEKSSRVVEVLLAAVRPIQLLGGKVLGIGLVALGQATLVVGFALLMARAVGSDVLKGSEPVALLAELCWLVLGYAFYCWVYAAAGSMAERQDQVQTLAFPLSIPILIGYIFSITVASSGNASLLFKVLAYLPLTAPFAMSVLVSLSQVAWWQFVISVLITLASTAGVALFAARIYSRAVLRTGGRVRLAELRTQ
ncbi:MAG TPA: ABC transporter permease [Acidimicrobiales bacterium]|jgi:ABC-2 type transport system permease protein|nr:ABC transporter permease [Acidimicrobiales bacterium]